jgi:iron complex outermembrane receptor protein
LKTHYSFLLLSAILSAELIAENSPITIDKMTVLNKETDEKNSSSTVEFARQPDLGQILNNNYSEISLVRSSSIGNDIILRGFKKDNINITVDGAKIYGACPNRMDPPSMHVSTSSVNNIQLTEGPFDVRNFGSLGGSINVETKYPTEEFKGEIGGTIGSFGYLKSYLELQGGEKDVVSIIGGASYETSKQYEDGDGKTLVEQVDSLAKMSGDKYLDSEKDRSAYTRKTYWLKTQLHLTDNSLLNFSYLKDDASDVLYPAFQMDAQVDTTDSLNLEYKILGLGFTESLAFQYYGSFVDHEMGTHFRNSSQSSTTHRTHKAESTIHGGRIEAKIPVNSIDYDTKITAGLDMSSRNWNGECQKEPSRDFKQTRIPNVTTDNLAFYSEAKLKYSDEVRLSGGIRIDATDIAPDYDLVKNNANPTPVKTVYSENIDKDYLNFSGNIFANYNFTKNGNLFIGVGQSSRVPDAQELYFIGFKVVDGKAIWTRKGNNELEPTINREIDLGFDFKIDTIQVKATGFYSDLENYIYTYSDTKNSVNLTFANIDAYIYGGDLSFAQKLIDNLNLTAGVAYQRGVKKEKEQKTDASSSKNLAEIPPFKGNLALIYDDKEYFAETRLLFASEQSNVDTQNGEKHIDGYSVVNLKVGKTWNKSFSLNFGIDNLFNETYAISNSYVGRGLISSNSDTLPLILNEAGRYYYTNFTFKF